MIRLKNTAEVSKIRDASAILAETLQELAKLVQEGVSTLELDEFARERIRRSGGEPAFLGYNQFPASLCVSINEQVIHGIPGKRRLRAGDIVGLDIGINLQGYFSDTAITLAVGGISEQRARLLAVTRECLARGVQAALAGNRISQISTAIYEHARANSFEVVRQFCGHGVGFALHEEPQIPNYVSSGPNPRLKPGMVLALEPMVNVGTWEVEILEDEWTVVTADGGDSAHFEHTIVIHKDHTEVLTCSELLP
jgi:methionyl aminopeptidase